MKINKLKSVLLGATTIAVALSVGFAAPASAMITTLTSDVSSVERNGDGVLFTSNIPRGSSVAIFVNGDDGFSGVWDETAGETTEPLPWEAFSPCVTIDVTFRVYNEVYVDQVYTFSDPYAASVTVQWIGDNTVDCDDTWGAGESAEELAPTGSDASTVAGMTGIAGLAALAVAVAVARRSRRAQR